MLQGMRSDYKMESLGRWVAMVRHAAFTFALNRKLQQAFGDAFMSIFTRYIAFVGVNVLGRILCCIGGCPGSAVNSSSSRWG